MTNGCLPQATAFTYAVISCLNTGNFSPEIDGESSKSSNMTRAGTSIKLGWGNGRRNLGTNLHDYRHGWQKTILRDRRASYAMHSSNERSQTWSWFSWVRMSKVGSYNASTFSIRFNWGVELSKCSELAKTEMPVELNFVVRSTKYTRADSTLFNQLSWTEQRCLNWPKFNFSRWLEMQWHDAFSISVFSA